MLSGTETLLLLGGDLGDVRQTLDKTQILLASEAGTVMASSREHWTMPWGFTGQGLFLNRAILLDTTLSPTELLGVLLHIETKLGRVRNGAQGYTSRTVDIDILLMGGTVLDRTDLCIPHPRMHLRRFALAPAADVAPEAIHPVLGRSIRELLIEHDRKTATIA
jgi:2-amino-4-hydroxy-6-hydroxymethyldihydropteridine diphosphokinase